MRKVTDVLRLKYSANLSHRQIAAALNLSIGVISKYLTAAKNAGITSYPLPAEMSETELEHLIFGAPAPHQPTRFAEPDFEALHQELKRKGVTLQLLWEEYREAGELTAQTGELQLPLYSYSQFCSRYRDWRARLKTSIRQIHRAGEKMFVDYAGQTVPIVNILTGEASEAQIFVAVLGASNYSYAEATLTQTLPDWIASHVRALEFFGGVPQLIVPDNLKSGITRACRYEPELNRTYAELAAHYETAVVWDS